MKLSKIKWIYEDETPDPDMKYLPTPVGYRVLVRILPAKKQTASGLVLPDDARELDSRAQRAGRVIAVGNDAYTRSDMNGAWCKVGDLVMIPRHGPIRLKVDDIEFALLNDDEVIAVFDDVSRMNLSYY